ncbi:hypothetical protein [Pseudomonas sp. Pc102]|uniref:hypothetical protein n=1 Tax=Pseudomonas sp. Pc102 TaxID=2678261 RepID=UPI001BD06199|nr:hypothetical protein [Pseudomonas sp. Pc102]
MFTRKTSALINGLAFGFLSLIPYGLALWLNSDGGDFFVSAPLLLAFPLIIMMNKIGGGVASLLLSYLILGAAWGGLRRLPRDRGAMVISITWRFVGLMSVPAITLLSIASLFMK